MRTTVTLDDDLYRQTKVHAARSGRSVGEVIEDALRTALAAGAEPRPQSPLPTWGHLGTLPGVDMTDNAALLGAMDDHVALDAKR